MKIPNKLLIVLILIVFISENILAQKDNESEEFKHFRVSLALGHAYIPQANLGDLKTLIIPSLGLDFEYWFSPKWGIGLKGDLEIATYTVEKRGLDEIEIIRENPLLLALPVFFSPWDNGLSFLAGPGMEFEQNEDFFIIRLGLGYELEFGNQWYFFPEFIYDLKDKNINSYTIAFGIGKSF